MKKHTHIAILYPAYFLSAKYRQYKVIIVLGAFLVSYLYIFFKFLSGYMITDISIWTALAVSPFIVNPKGALKKTFRYVWLSIGFCMLAFITGVKTFFFLSIGFAILFAIEGFLGQIGYLPMFLLGILSPTFKYFNNMFGFPARITLSEWAGNTLQQIGYKIEVIGNVIIKDGVEFSVDPACVGLNMMAFAFITGIFIMAFYERQTNTRFSFIKIIVIILTIIILNILANLIRIILLTLFEVMPENPSHEIIGIACFLVYVIIPSYFLIKFEAKRNTPTSNVSFHGPGISTTVFNILLIISVTITGFTKIKDAAKTNTVEFQIPGFTKTMVDGDIVKLEKKGILLYIKPLSRFYGAEHNPMICWTGSGYKFTRINRQIIGNKEVYTGTLIKNKDVIYAAWWFDNGKYQTISQIDWRWRAYKGENFYLVNVNAADEKILKSEVCNLLKQNINN